MSTGTVYVWLNPFTVHLKLVTTSLIVYTPIQNKKLKKKKVSKNFQIFPGRQNHPQIRTTARVTSYCSVVLHYFKIVFYNNLSVLNCKVKYPETITKFFRNSFPSSFTDSIF